MVDKLASLSVVFFLLVLQLLERMIADCITNGSHVRCTYLPVLFDEKVHGAGVPPTTEPLKEDEVANHGCRCTTHTRRTVHVNFQSFVVYHII